MTKILRIAALVATAAITTLSAVPASAQTAQTSATASIKKPVLINRVADMNFGEILLSGTGTFSAEVVLDAATGIVSCPTSVTCTGSTAAAVYNVTGNRSQQVTIGADPTVTLNGSNGGTLSMTVTAPSSVTLPNSGNAGIEFPVGGTLTVPSSAVDGTYTGQINVTANFN